MNKFTVIYKDEDGKKQFNIRPESFQTAIFSEKNHKFMNALLYSFMKIQERITGVDVTDPDIKVNIFTATINFDGFAEVIITHGPKGDNIAFKDLITGQFVKDLPTIISFHIRNMYFINMQDRKIRSFYRTMASENNWVGEFLIWNKQKAEALYEAHGLKCNIVDNKTITFEDESISMEDAADFMTYIAAISGFDSDANVIFYNTDDVESIPDNLPEDYCEINSALFIIKN